MIMRGIRSIDTAHPRVRKYLTMALRESTRSNYGRVKIGSVILTSTGKLITGWNQKKTHPLQAKYNETKRSFCKNPYLHAEIHALSRTLSNENLAGATVFVARQDNAGAIADSRPCPACAAALLDSGVELCYFTERSVR